MNKVICNICGTSYPENAAQCPICGFSRSNDGVDALTADSEPTYQYVKGGRFSKQNVKKRNSAKQAVAVKSVEVETKKAPVESKQKGNGFMIVIIVILLLAIIAVVGYIAMRFFLPNNFLFEGTDMFTKPSVSQTDNVPEEDENEPEMPAACTAVSLDKNEIAFEGIGSTYTLHVNLEPVNTADTLTFTSSDEAVATVSTDGMITTVGEGSAVITVTCGTVSAECAITCVVPTAEPEVPLIALNRREITFDMEGQSWLLYDGDVPIEEITWSSDDNNVATINAGKVVAVADGDTTVYAVYGDQTVSCLIHCKFDEASSNSGSVSEASGDNKTYSLYNPTGMSEDVTIRVGQKFTLKLVDEDKNEVTDATWTVSKKSICSYKDSTVKALAKGTAKVVAEYNGKTYTCIVRVVE